MTSSHRAYDERFFHKQAKSLLGAGYDATIIAPHPADEVADGIRIKAVPKPGGRLERLLITPLRVLAAGIREKADIYHFHDPELIPAGLALRLLGRKVIYDSHEYYKLKVLSYNRIPGGLRQIVAWVYDVLETLSSRLFNGVVVVDSVTEAKFKGMATMVSNFPFKSSITSRPKKKDGSFRCVYVGGLEGDRGLFKMVEAMEHVDDRVRLVLAGHMSEENLRKAKQLKGYERVEYLGFIPWKSVLEMLPDCDLGLLLLQPVPGYLYHGENSIKLFEYMMASLPVLCSDFPNLKRIIGQESCGITVDPTDPVEIGKKIMYLSDNPGVAGRMGENGRKAVKEKYNWEMEAKKLLGLYGRILEGGLMVRGRKAEA
jgi:glycosyltransferase involved in cell wall biosynthesis